MSVTHEGATTRVKYSGRFDYKEFYKFFFDVIVSNGYVITGDAHAQKVKSTGEEVEIDWDFEKRVDDYTKFKIHVKIFVTDLNPVIIKKGGEEFNTDEGNVEVIISSRVETDWQDLWEKNRFLEMLRDFYERYLFKQTLDNYVEEVHMDAFNFGAEVKSFFNQPGF